MELRNHFDIRDLALRDDGIGGKIAITVQKQMQFDGPFGSTELCPVKQGNREINDRGVHAQQLILESELFPSLNLALASVQQLQKEPCVELPGTLLISIGEGEATGSGNSKMSQFTLTDSQTTRDFSERMGSAKLAEKHGNKLDPAGESSGVTFCLGFFHSFLKLHSIKQL